MCFYIFATNITCGRNSNCIYVQNNKHICYIYTHRVRCVPWLFWYQCMDTHVCIYIYTQRSAGVFFLRVFVFIIDRHLQARDREGHARIATRQPSATYLHRLRCGAMERMARESSPRILDKITRCNCVHMYYIICIYVDFCIGIYIYIDVNMVVWIPIQCLDRVYVHIYKYICFVMSPIVGSGECMSKRTCRAIYIYIYIYRYEHIYVYMYIQ